MDPETVRQRVHYWKTDYRRWVAELARATVPRVDATPPDPPPCDGPWATPPDVRGQLGPYTFTRGSGYWVVEGHVPLALAHELYADPAGRADIRVGGHCGCPAPGTYGTVWLDSDGREVLDRLNEDEARRVSRSTSELLRRIGLSILAGYRFADDPAAVAAGYVPLYHIDSELGLRVFADGVRRHDLLRPGAVPPLRSPAADTPAGDAPANNPAAI